MAGDRRAFAPPAQLQLKVTEQPVPQEQGQSWHCLLSPCTEPGAEPGRGSPRCQLGSMLREFQLLQVFKHLSHPASQPEFLVHGYFWMHSWFHHFCSSAVQGQEKTPIPKEKVPFSHTDFLIYKYIKELCLNHFFYIYYYFGTSPFFCSFTVFSLDFQEPL